MRGREGINGYCATKSLRVVVDKNHVGESRKSAVGFTLTSCSERGEEKSKRAKDTQGRGVRREGEDDKDGSTCG